MNSWSFVRCARHCVLFVSLLVLIQQSVPVAVAQPGVVIGQNFTGSSFGVDSLGIPADSDGVAGPQHFVEFINGSFAVYNKTNHQVLKRISDSTFWSDAGVALANDAGVADPRVLYDPAVQRWFASMIDFNANAPTDPSLFANNFLLAVSATADPKGTWKGFKFQADPDTGTFADFPTLGVDSNGVYLSAEMYHGEDNPLGSGLVSFPKADLLATTPTISNRTWFGVMDYSQRGQVLQPAVCSDGSAVGRILATSDYGTDSDPHSNLVSFAVQNAGQPAATLSSSTLIPTAPWVVPDSPYLPAPQFHPIQPDGTDTLAANEARLGANVYAVGGILHAVHCTEWNGRVALRWYRIRAIDNVLLESGTITDPSLDLFHPSIAANALGVVVIGFNGCGLNTYISCYAMVGQTLNSVTTFGNRLLLKASDVSYHDIYELATLNEYSRWGDYSTASVDPSDPNRFWTIQMYAIADELFDSVWATQITELITTPSVWLSVQPAGSDVKLSWPLEAGGYQLQSATNLVSPITWSDVAQPPQTNGNQLFVQLSAADAKQFFRLRK